MHSQTFLWKALNFYRSRLVIKQASRSSSAGVPAAERFGGSAGVGFASKAPSARHIDISMVAQFELEGILQ